MCVDIYLHIIFFSFLIDINNSIGIYLHTCSFLLLFIRSRFIMSSSSCCKKGPGYASPLEAMQNGSREKLLYVAMIPCQENQADYLATIDVDPESANYQKVIHRLYVPNLDNELHHFGWNACSSCHTDGDKQRRFIVLGGFKSSIIYIIDTADQTKPSLYKIIDSQELKKLDLSAPHTVHCLGK